jgi:hypothetical protein
LTPRKREIPNWSGKEEVDKLSFSKEKIAGVDMVY